MIGTQLSIWQRLPGLRTDSQYTQCGLWFLFARTTNLDLPKADPVVWTAGDYWKKRLTVKELNLQTVS